MACGSRSARSSAATACVGELADDVLDLRVRAAGVDDRAQPLDLGQRRAASRARRRAAAASAVVGRVQGEGDQHGALALDQVVAGGLAGGGRVTEDAEQVVAQLEGLARAAARTPTARRSSRGVAPASAAPMCSGRSMEYFADL